MSIEILCSEEDEKYIRLMCTRKGMTLFDYIMDNFEWDDKPVCLLSEDPISKKDCAECEWGDQCPDNLNRKKKKRERKP